MKIIGAEINNFLGIGYAVIPLADQGLVLVQGDNQDESSADSNGSGKSSIGDAVSWCLFGETARGISGDDVVNTTAGKGCYVALQLDDNGQHLVVTRHRKNGKHKNSLVVEEIDGAGDSHDLSKGTDKLTQEYLEKIIGCSLNVFRAAVYSAQEAIPDLPNMTDKELKLIVEEAAGIEELQAAYALTNKKLSDAEAMQERQRIRMDGLNQRKADHVKFLDMAKNEYAGWNSARDTKIAALGAAAVADTQSYKEWVAKFDAGLMAKLDAEIAQHSAILAAVESEKAEERRLAHVAETIAKVVAEARVSARTTNETLTRSLGHLKGIEGQVGKPCNECGKAYCTDDIHDARVIAGTNALSAKKARDEAQSLLEQSVNGANSSAQELEAFRASMTDITATVAARDDLQRRRADAANEHSALQRAKVEIVNLVADIKKLKAEANPHFGKIDTLTKQIEAIEHEIAELASDAAATGDRIGVLKHVSAIFGPAGVRAHILDNVTPFLNARTAHYLGALSDGNINATWQTITFTAKGEPREKFQIIVGSNAGATSFKAHSGGEKRKVRLATALALQDLVASRAAKPIDLWIGDEIDDALDASGLERLMGVLQEKARERGTVLVISHADLKDWIPNSITVVRKGGMSTITVGA